MRAVKGFTLFDSKEDMNNTIKIIKLLENVGALIDRVTETKKHEINKREAGFLGAPLTPLAASLVQPVISSVVNVISGRVNRRAGKEYLNKNFWF